MKLEPPGGAETFETTYSTMWFDENNILCSVSRKNAVITKETLDHSFNMIRIRAKGEKVCWIGDVTNITSADKEARDYAANETPKFIKALALITNSPLSRMVANIFLNLKKLPFPVKMFTSEEEARNWIAKYL